MMRLIILLIALSVAVQTARSAPSGEKVDCSKLDEVLDDLGGAQGITTMQLDKYKLTTTAEELSKKCLEAPEALKTLRKYNKECYSSLTQQVFGAILRTRVQFNENTCKSPDSQEFKNVLEAVKCINDNAVESVKEAEKKIVLQAQVLFESNIADEKLRLRNACCFVLASKQHFLEATKDKCQKHAKVYGDYVESYSSEAMGLICPEPEKLECSKLAAVKIDGVTPKSKFFLNPMMKLVKSLDH